MKQETLEEAAENYGWRIKINTFSNPVKANDLANSAKQDFIEGAKWQQERMYSEEEVFEIIALFVNDAPHNTKEWFEQFKKK
jgi:fructose-specific phosphotransferase system component IIB